MKCKYIRSGGIAGLKIVRDFDSDSLPPNHLATFHHLLNSSSSTQPSHPDEFIHELRTGNKTFRFLDSQLTAEAVAFFQFVTSLR